MSAGHSTDLPGSQILRREEVVALSEAAVPSTLRAPASPIAFAAARVLRREVSLAQEEARRVRTAAEEHAAQLLSQAEHKARELEEAARKLGRAEGHAAGLAQALQFTEAEQRAEERNLEKSISLARLLAERLLGKALELQPELVVDMARQLLSEVRGARQARLLAHPSQVAILQEALGGEETSVQVLAHPALAPGNLRLETEVGALDAELGQRLDLLTSHLKDQLGHG